jgi:arylsulfatase A-like enzyme
MYEGGIRVPAAVAWPGTLEPGRKDDPVSVADWMPTFAGVSGATAPPEAAWDGRDIWGQITGEGEAPAERELYWNFRGASGLAARRGDWKLIEHDADGDEPVRELFNIAEDPYETQELSNKNPKMVDELHELIINERGSDGTSARTDVDGPDVA